MQVVHWIKSWKQNKVQHLDKLIMLLILKLGCHCRKFAFIWVQEGMISFPVLDLSVAVSQLLSDHGLGRNVALFPPV